MTTKIQDQLQRMPDYPGVYLFKDVHQRILYIGKAKSLKKRVRSYFKGNLNSPRLKMMVSKMDFIDFIVTDNEIEALILEDSLIKKNKPRYNVLLKDDKKFPWIMITDEVYPRIEIVRKPLTKAHRGKAKFFGPYADVGKMRQTLNLIKTIFPLRKRKTPLFKDRPCMNYDIGQCMAPCQKLISVQDYQKIVWQVEMLLTGKQTTLRTFLEHNMQEAAQKQEYEKAMKYRDALLAILKTQEEQKIVMDGADIHQDILSYAQDDLRLVISMFKIREGRIIAKDDFEIDLEASDKNLEEYFYRFLQGYYQHIAKDTIGHEIYLDFYLEDMDVFQQWIESLVKYPIQLFSSQTSTTFPLLDMVRNNAQLALENFQKQALYKVADEWNLTGLYIQRTLKLPEFPYRVECFDISHIQGTHTVASMVVFINGKPSKADYRKFKINSVPTGKPDDFASMEEVITRRYSAVKEKNESLPELIIVDGGKGQLSSAVKALKKIGLETQPLVSLAKKFELLYLPNKARPIIFQKGSGALHFFQNIRDEAHRFAITFHKSLRSKSSVQSIVDSIPGLGEKRKKLLFRNFKTIHALKKASIEDIISIKGIPYTVAKNIYDSLNNC